METGSLSIRNIACRDGTWLIETGSLSTSNIARVGAKWIVETGCLSISNIFYPGSARKETAHISQLFVGFGFGNHLLEQ